MTGQAASNGGSRLERVYTSISVALLGSVLVFAALNALLLIIPSYRPSTGVGTPTPMASLGVERLLPAYPGWTRDALLDLHAESRVIYAFEPIVQFRIKPIAGKYVNQSPYGFRQNVQPVPWPVNPDAFNVFVFGGSTTFGWLLADGDTIVSRLQDGLLKANCGSPVHVYNFGQPAYLSTQEALLFESLVRRGIVPDTAVFIDGLNDFFYDGKMAFTDALRTMMDETDARMRYGMLVDLPLYKLARRIRDSLSAPPPIVDDAAKQQQVERVIAQWLENKAFVEAIGRQYGVDTLFVWQPVPSFKYDLSRHFLYRDGIPDPVPYASIGRAYQVMDTRRAELERQGNFFWLADIQEARRENLYVDRIHYSAAFSGDIAGEIQRRLLPMVGCTP